MEQKKKKSKDEEKKMGNPVYIDRSSVSSTGDIPPFPVRKSPFNRL